jgi:hypothetical protein
VADTFGVSEQLELDNTNLKGAHNLNDKELGPYSNRKELMQQEGHNLATGEEQVDIGRDMIEHMKMSV